MSDSTFPALEWARLVGSTSFKNPATRHLAFLHLSYVDAASATCRPTVEQLAARLGLKVRQVKNLRHELVALGCLDPVEKGHRGKASVYRLRFSADSGQLHPFVAGDIRAQERDAAPQKRVQ
jgi:hypothetical protein